MRRYCGNKLEEMMVEDYKENDYLLLTLRCVGSACDEMSERTLVRMKGRINWNERVILINVN